MTLGVYLNIKKSSYTILITTDIVIVLQETTDIVMVSSGLIWGIFFYLNLINRMYDKGNIESLQNNNKSDFHICIPLSLSGIDMVAVSDILFRVIFVYSYKNRMKRPLK